MLIKKTSKNQITLPEEMVERFSDVECFEVSTDGACIILFPSRKRRAEEVRSRLAKRQLVEKDVQAAVRWARKQA